MPFFNRQNNDDLILAIQTAGVVRGRNGFRKDKGGEKLDETEENLLEHRTDGTVLGICFFDILKLDSFPKSAKIYVFCLNLCRLKHFSNKQTLFLFRKLSFSKIKL